MVYFHVLLNLQEEAIRDFDSWLSATKNREDEGPAQGM